MTVPREADPLLGQACLAYQLQARPHSTSLSALSTLQDQLETGFAEALFRIPAASLHLTILPLIDAVEEPPLPAPAGDLWRTHERTWMHAIDLACAIVPGFLLRPTEILYTSRAVILLARSPNPIEALRQQLAENCRLPHRCVRVPTITHVTLFRYLRPDLVVERSRTDTLPDGIFVDEVRLVQENIYPSLDVTVIRSWQLPGTTPVTRAAIKMPSVSGHLSYLPPGH